MARSTSGESVLERAVRVLEAFTPETTSLQVSEVAKRANLPLATASRLVGELVKHSLLVREPDRSVRIGLRLWELASRASPTLSLREVAMPDMERLHLAIGHHTQLGILDGDEVLFVERLSADNAVVNFTRIAARLPLHASSSGLVLLAFGSPQLQERVLAQPMHRYTPATVTTAAALRTILADVRRHGFVVCQGYLHPDAAGVAVPVRSHDKQVLAALSVIVPNDEQARGCVHALAAAARSIERRLTNASPAS